MADTACVPSVTVERAGGGYVRPVCPCGWVGVTYSTRVVEGHTLAVRDARDHEWAHEHGAGWFDYLRGWVVNPTPCLTSCHYTTPHGTRALASTP